MLDSHGAAKVEDMDDPLSAPAISALPAPPLPPSNIQPGNRRVARFYDWAHVLYPLVEVFCGGGRRRLIAEINGIRRVGSLTAGGAARLCENSPHSAVPKPSIMPMH